MKHWNSLNQGKVSAGSINPVLCVPCSKRQYGAKVVNPIEVGEIIPAGTPFEFSASERTAKFLKTWKVKSTSVSGSNTTIVIEKKVFTPKLKSGMSIMVVPSTLDGKGLGANCGVVTETDDTYSITIATADIDTVTTGTILVESNGVGASKGVYAKPNNISIEDVVGGVYTMVEVPRGHIYMYENTINVISSIVKEKLFNSDVQVCWELYNE